MSTDSSHMSNHPVYNESYLHSGIRADSAVATMIVVSIFGNGSFRALTQSNCLSLKIPEREGEKLSSKTKYLWVSLAIALAY